MLEAGACGVPVVFSSHQLDLVERLCVVDVAPVAYQHASEFVRYIDAMLAIDLLGAPPLLGEVLALSQLVELALQ